MFKSTWEKTSTQHPFSEDMIYNMVRLAHPSKKLLAYQLISGGCVNLNFRIKLEDNASPLILRIYIRDQDACYREQKLATLLKDNIPIPQVYYINEQNGYHFAITEFIEGITLSDLLLSDLAYDLYGIMHEVGVILSNISSHTYSKSGFFDNDLNIAIQTTSRDLVIFQEGCLQNQIVVSILTPQHIAKIQHYFHIYHTLLPSHEKQLVHGDFDPANILVHQINSTWHVSGILDWEFAFSGSMLWDVANMLRYAHQMPTTYQDAFLEGMTQNGITLPENWHISIRLLNISSLLDCLQRSDPLVTPKRCADIRALIEYHIAELDRVKFINKY